jgi:hypothetical protein
MSSRFNGILEKLISKENKDRIKHNLINPLLIEISREAKPYLFCLVGLYMSLIIPLLLITVMLSLQLRKTS